MSALREICGATWTYPSDPTVLRRQGFTETFAGVEVTCDSEPHSCNPHDVVHSAPIFVGEKLRGIKYWGPGYVPVF
ncbi:hypothetical protein D9753_30420 [Streptomyces dangxiongensis]|uniref:Uncharacterized protein n=1 Tax=Streptomyces dangxiongensis TaxID=1442032 RepID=A0A3G2JM43_9ACTN|nr:hypothetical protein [Streptomyces dangxiongensis]AYN42485.1 hypothetical protein D9753_30420 [Streptomyces dangxiongensis]